MEDGAQAYRCLRRATSRWRRCCAGGFTFFGGAGASGVLGDHYALDAEARQWVAMPQLPQAVDAAVAHAVGSKLYVIGGGLGGPVATGRVQIYNSETRTWTAGAAMPTPRFSAASETWCYVARDHAWVRGPDMRTPRVEPAVAQIGGRVITIGGRTRARLAAGVAESLGR